MKFIFALHKNLKKAQKILFLDRDGVVIRDTGYPYQKDKVIFEIENILKIKKLINDGNFDLCGFVTNQSGVARDIFTEIEFWSFHNMIIEKCISLELSIHFTAVNFFKNNEYYRKPNNGMIEQAMNFFQIKTENCLFIGDKETDEAAASKSKINFIYIQNLVSK